MKFSPSGMLLTAATLLPAALSAQTSTSTSEQRSSQVGTQVSAQASASANARIPSSFSAEGRQRLAALYSDAEARGLSSMSMANLVAEGQGKGASEARIVDAARSKYTQLSVTQEAMLRAGRTAPTPEEVDRGANLMARGATAVQIEQLTRRAPAERSLTVAFEVLTDLAAKGMPVDHALTQVQTRLEQRASDAALRELGVGLGLGLSTRGQAGAAGSSAPATPPATPPASNPSGRAGVGATVTGAMGGVIRKP